MSRTVAEGRSERIVFLASASELASLDTWRHANKIGSRAEAIRRLVALGTARSETKQILVDRLGGMPPEDAAREACGHPLVVSVIMQPAVVIQFVDGSDLRFEAQP